MTVTAPVVAIRGVRRAPPLKRQTSSVRTLATEIP